MRGMLPGLLELGVTHNSRVSFSLMISVEMVEFGNSYEDGKGHLCLSSA